MPQIMPCMPVQRWQRRSKRSRLRTGRQRWCRWIVASRQSCALDEAVKHPQFIARQAIVAWIDNGVEPVCARRSSCRTGRPLMMQPAAGRRAPIVHSVLQARLAILPMNLNYPAPLLA
jgi:hypothetical protein